MDADELRQACERLGWKHGPYAEYVTEPHPSGQMLNGKPAVRFWQLDDYALPAYVASLLVAMVRERGFELHASTRPRGSYVVVRTPRSVEPEYSAVTPELEMAEAIIRAAMEVLDGQ